MPVFSVSNIQKIQIISNELGFPSWLVKALALEYLPCRYFQGSSVTIDYGLVTSDELKSIAKPYVFLNGLTLFHNITEQVMVQRMLYGLFGGFPSTGLTKQETFVLPEGKVSPHFHLFPQMNTDEVEGDWKLRLNLHQRAVVMDDNEIYQWLVTTFAMIPADISQRWYESNVFTNDELEELRRINIDYIQLNQLASSPDIVEQRLKKLYEDLEALHNRMRRTVFAYHQTNKDKPEAKAGYTNDAPPQLTLFDEFIIEKDRTTKQRRIKVRSYVEPLFFRAAYRASERAREVRKNIDAGEMYPVPIAEEIEAAAESIVLSAMCLEAYINGFVQDHLAEHAPYIERMEIRAKWLLVPALLGKPDCFKSGSQPFDTFSEIITWRNDDLAHYKHKFRYPVTLGSLGTVSELHFVCNADNSEKAVKTVREMIQRLNQYLSFPSPTWIQDDTMITGWLKPINSVMKEKQDKQRNTSQSVVRFQINNSNDSAT